MRGRGQNRRALGSWPVHVALAAAAAAGLAVAVATLAVPGQRDASVLDMVWLVSWVSFALVGALVVVHVPRHPAGLVLLAIGTMIPVAGLLDVLTFWVAGRQGEGAAPVAYLRLGQSLLFDAGLGLVLASVVLLPDGRLAQRWMRWPARAGIAAAAGTVLVGLVSPGPIGESLPLDNPLGLSGAKGLLDVLGGLCTLLLLASALTGVLSLVLRTRRAHGTTRTQLAWLALGLLTVTAVNLLGAGLLALGVSVPQGAGALLAALTLPVVPACIAVATLRHNLYDVELLLRRAIVYSVLSGGLLVACLVVAAAFGRGTTGAGASALVGGLVAVALLPLRGRLQRLLERRFYGESGDPYRVLSGLGRQLTGTLAPEEVPALVARSVCTALRVPWAAVELGARDDVGALAAQVGVPPPWAPISLPLTVHGSEVGRLLVAPRRAAEPLEERDLRLLADLADQVAVAVDGLRLSRELQRSREDLVLAREEERRRLRNDLHDGLGPVLAGVLLQLAVARESTADGAVAQVLGTAETRLGGAVADLRRLVYGLRPPALDELGLDGALREHVAATSTGSALEVSLEIPEPLSGLPAAVEVAAFRVATEALVNVVRHSGARHCELVLRQDQDHLLVEVRDDGTGLAGRPGVGLSSMRERCAELGGSCEVLAAVPHGTVVRARLPLGAHDG